MKKAAIILVILPLLTIGLIIFATTVKEPDKKQIQTNAEPIYNHFPDLPTTEMIQWSSKSSSGIGPTTVWLYVFAFYDHDISANFSDKGILKEKSDFYFLPQNFKLDHTKWRKLENMDAAFQSGIKDGERMNTSVYLNEAGNILYMEAVGD